MSTKVIERPAALSFSKNDLRYVFFTDNTNVQGLYVQVELYTRITKGSSFVNWKCQQYSDDSIYIDANLFILVNGAYAVQEFNSNTGSFPIKAGDVVRAVVPAYDPWPGTGSPYAKLIVKVDGTELYNNYSADPSEAGWVEFTFTAEAGKQYTINGYTSTEGALAHTEDLEMAEVNTYTLQKTFNLRPNPDGKTYLYLGERINSLLNYVLPELSYVVKNASEQSAEYYIRFREITAADADPDWIETEEDHIRRVLKGGVEKQRASRDNYFTYRATGKYFFTWFPNNRFIFADERAFLSIYLSGSGYKLRVSVMRIDEVTASNDIDIDLSEGVFFHLNVSPGILDIDGIASAQPVRYYEVSVINASETVIYNARRFYIEYRPSYMGFDFVFHNSLGGADHIRVKGETTWSIERNIQEAEGTMDVNDWNAEEKKGESGESDITKLDSYKGDIGFLRTADNKMKILQECLQEILVSKSIYQYQDSRWIKVRNMQKSIDLRSSADKKFSMPIEWQLPFNNPVFTPKDVILGIATDTETYD